VFEAAAVGRGIFARIAAPGSPHPDMPIARAIIAAACPGVAS